MKPVCKLIGEDGNIFNLCSIASKTLRRAGLSKQIKKMQNEVVKSKSYEEALAVIGEYVDIE